MSNQSKATVRKLAKDFEHVLAVAAELEEYTQAKTTLEELRTKQAAESGKLAKLRTDTAKVKAEHEKAGDDMLACELQCQEMMDTAQEFYNSMLSTASAEANALMKQATDNIQAEAKAEAKAVKAHKERMTILKLEEDAALSRLAAAQAEFEKFRKVFE